MKQPILWLVLGLASVGIGTAEAAEVPAPLTGVVLSATATRDTGTGIYTYRYRIINPAANEASIARWGVELNRMTGEANLSEEGLVNGPRYLRAGSAATRSQVPMVPVGMSGPNGWLLGLAYRDGPPTRGLAAWGADDEPFLVRPGQTQLGFQLTSYGLPGIRPAEIEPDIHPESLPEESGELREQLTLHTKTIGPKAPPVQFVPLEFLNYLIALLHDSRQQGWVKVDGIHQSLLAKLLAAKRSLEAGQAQAAHGQLKAFLNEVQAVSCPEFSCPGNKPLTSEAYALLYFNGQYLFERLPATGVR